MVSRLVLAVCAALLVALLPSAAQARTIDSVIVRDTQIQYIWALYGDLVYYRGGNPSPERAWMARYHGHLQRADGIPRTAGFGALGLDAKGRKVLTFGVSQSKNGPYFSTKWFLYDLGSNRTHAVHGLPSDCSVDWLSVWRSSMAYTAHCKGDMTQHPLFLKRGKRTRLLQTDPGGYDLAYRAGALGVVFDDGLDDFFIVQLAAHYRSCVRRVDPSFGDATDSAGWYPSRVFATGGYFAWVMGNPGFRSDFAILAAKIRSGCHQPSPIGQFPFTPKTRVDSIAVDTRHVFYSDGNELHSQTIPAKPSFARPSNDNFAHARELSGDAPLSATGNTAHATTQHGEPLGRTGHTVWYAFRPKTSGTFYVTVTPACPYNPPGDACNGTYRSGVYTGSKLDALTKIPASGGPYSRVYTRIDAQAGETYRIVVGSTVEAKYEPFKVLVDSSPPG